MNDNDEVSGGEVAPLVSGALAEITKAEIDTQIATAKQYPRSLQSFKQTAVALATIDEETAASTIYRRQVGMKNGKPEYAEGMSIRMAEIAAAAYGNLRYGAQLIEVTPRFVKARGFAHDLQTNVASTSEVIEATVTKDGKPFSERMRLVVAKAALAKARRDAIFGVVPRALCRPVEAAARAVAVGNAQTLASRRKKVIDWVDKLGVERAHVWAALGIKGEDDISLEILETLLGIATAIKEGEMTPDEAFPDPKAREKAAASTVAERAAAARASSADSQPGQNAPAAPEPQPEPKPAPEPRQEAQEKPKESAPQKEPRRRAAQPAPAAAAGDLLGGQPPQEAAKPAAPKADIPDAWKAKVDEARKVGDDFGLSVLMDEAKESLDFDVYNALKAYSEQP